MTDTHKTAAVPNPDPKKDLRVVWDATGTRILSDKRNQTSSSKITFPSQQPTTSRPSSVPKPQTSLPPPSSALQSFQRKWKVIGRK